MSIQEIPGLVIEFRDMAKAYLIQETVEPAKQLGHLSGFSLGAALTWAAAIILLAVAAMRAIVDALPDGPYWESLGYLITVIVLLLLAALIASLGPKSPEEATAESEEAA